MSQGKGQSSTPRPQYFDSATQLLASLRERRIGAVELLNLHLEQVDKDNPALNLVAARDVEGALMGNPLKPGYFDVNAAPCARPQA